MLKLFIKQAIRFFGYDFHRYSPVLSSNDAQLIAMLKQHRVNTIFDVGANLGQFGTQLRKYGYDGRIVSFEPLSTVRKKLQHVSADDPFWEVAPQAAIGNEEGEVVINIASNSVSSSVLDMLDTHSDVAPDSTYVGNEIVPLRRLDTLGINYIQSDTVLFIKIDTQGYEDKVLQGSFELLKDAVGLQLELSFIPLYRGQPLYGEMIEQLKNLGFELWGLVPVLIDPINGRLLQVDATFFRTSV
jgi:FkbM family methyltransferase